MGVLPRVLRRAWTQVTREPRAPADSAQLWESALGSASPAQQLEPGAGCHAPSGTAHGMGRGFERGRVPPGAAQLLPHLSFPDLSNGCRPAVAPAPLVDDYGAGNH